MRLRPSPVEALIQLPRLPDAGERRAAWRQAVAALGQGVRVSGPPPLDALEPVDITRAVDVALATGLADDLDFIAAGPAAVALYELMAALPAGKSRRELGRRVFTRLYEGTAATFAAVASRMALGAARSLDTPTLRARIGLVIDLPVGAQVDADALAYSFVGRRELLDRWVVRPARGALPARRFAARLLELAAREAVVRTQQGDPHAREMLSSGPVREPFLRLLADREPLVWRHAAVARGLLSVVDPRLADEIETALDPSLSPTEWRRAAVSLAASMTFDGRDGLARCRALVDGDLLSRRDPGLPATLIWGLPRVVESEPDAAEELLARLCTTGRGDVAEAAAALLGDTGSAGFGARVVEPLRRLLEQRLSQQPEVERVATERALRCLDRDRQDADSPALLVRRALADYESRGARAAYEAAMRALEAADRMVKRIEVFATLGEGGLPDLMGALGEIDEAALERTRLLDLLLLGRKPGDADGSVPELDRLHDRLGDYLLDAESQPHRAGTGFTLLARRRLTSLLHLVDTETAQRGEADEQTGRIRARLRRTLRVLLDAVAGGPEPGLDRIQCATLARAFDAAVRESVADPSELFLLVVRQLGSRAAVEPLVEASTHPEVQDALRAWLDFVSGRGAGAPSSVGRESLDSIHDLDPASLFLPEAEAGAAQRVLRLSAGLAGSGSYRSEAVRQVVLRLGRSLEAIAGARGLSDLVDVGAAGLPPLSELAQSTADLRLLLQRAARRVLEDDTPNIPVTTDAPPLAALIERAVTSGVPANAQQLAAAVSELTQDLPGALADAIRMVTAALARLPMAPESAITAIPLEKRRAALPDWLLPRRTLGAFYVVRSLGAGGTSSVFLARRYEERNDPKAESFALKVPQYDPTTARSLSEQQFLELFREEAGALLQLPSHSNLARFVTFDLAARPKPILVMELIRGQSLDRFIRSGGMSMERSLSLLDGVLQGLEAMHGQAVGHLDLKPGNVILRDPATPVLVDFGLSGRKLRPGCGTLEYCAPEILGVVPPGHTPTPMAADLYAFGCMAFEMLTGEELFTGADEMSVMAQHVDHDGWPTKLRRLAGNPEYADLAIVLAACLRQDPRQRPTAAQTRPALENAMLPLLDTPWPLHVPAVAASA